MIRMLIEHGFSHVEAERKALATMNPYVYAQGSDQRYLQPNLAVHCFTSTSGVDLKAIAKRTSGTTKAGR